MVGVAFVIPLFFNLRQRHTTYLLIYLLLLKKTSITLSKSKEASPYRHGSHLCHGSYLRDSIALGNSPSERGQELIFTWELHNYIMN